MVRRMKVPSPNNEDGMTIPINGAQPMLKLYAFSAFMLLAMGAAYDMPSKCFSGGRLPKCYATTVGSWVDRYPLNWDSVNYTRFFG